MSSEVEICNLALGNIRAGSINTLTESSLQAQQCKLKYPLLRDMLLTEIPWTFNRKIKALALTTEEIFDWAYAYQYPTDCLKLYRLVGAYEEVEVSGGGAVPRYRGYEGLISKADVRRQIPYEVFNINNNKILGADEIELRIDYAAKITDPNLFSNSFTLAFSHLLGAELAIPLIGAETGRQLRSDEMTLYKGYMDSAVADDMNDQYNEPKESEFVNVRR